MNLETTIKIERRFIGSWGDRYSHFDPTDPHATKITTMTKCHDCGLEGPPDDFADGCPRCEYRRDCNMDELERLGIEFVCVPVIGKKPIEPGYSAEEINEIIEETKVMR